MEYLFNIALDCTNAILIYVFYRIIFRKQRALPSAMIISVYCLMQIICDFVVSNFITDVSISHTIARSLISIALNFCAALFFESGMQHRIWAAVSYFAITYLAENVAFLFIDKFYLDHTFSEEDISAVSLSVTLVTNLLLFLFTMLLRIFWKAGSLIQSKTYAALLIITPLLSVGLSLYPPIFNLTFMNAETYFLLVMFLLFINILNYVFIRHIIKGEQLRSEIEILTEQIGYQKKKYDQLGEAYKNIRSFMHDTKKHLFYIEKCVNEEKYNEIIPYSKEMVLNLEARYCSINTGNLVIDAFVSNLLLQTQRNGIVLTTNLKIDNNIIPVNDYHLTIILGNLLDNALNACLKQCGGKINVSIQTIEETLTIYIANTFLLSDGSKTVNNPDDFDFVHGYGLKNVRSSAEQYNGIVVVQNENDIYSVTVIIPING